MKQWTRLIIGSVVIFHLKVFTVITKRPRVRVLVVNEKGQALLVRTFVSHGDWTLPGGGMKRRESPVAAAKREVLEEIGIEADESQFTYVATLTKSMHGAPFTVPLFCLTIDAGALTEQRINKREIAVARWFDGDKLPLRPSKIAVLAFDAYAKGGFGALRR